MNEMQSYLLWLYAPLFPAIILFLLFPKSGVVVEGDGGAVKNFFGINKFKITGAFAGYVILLVGSKTFLDDINKQKPEIWTIEGKVNYDLSDRTILLSEIQPRVQPQNFLVAGDGSFEMDIIVPKGPTGEPKFPKLSFEHPGFDSKTVHLSKQNILGLEDYQPLQNIEQKRITVTKPVILTH